MSSPYSDQERLEHPVSPACPGAPANTAPSSSCRPGSSVLMDGNFEGSLAENQVHHMTGEEFTKAGRSQVTIDMLPDIALLRIFDFYVDEDQIETWQTLVHVCQAWRNIVFESPRRLNLRLYCTARTPVREKLDAWPPLPIVMKFQESNSGAAGEDGILIMALHAALQHNDRICELDLDLNAFVPDSGLEKIWVAMRQPFPSLTRLQLHAVCEASVQPDSFLGGYAPRLQTLVLELNPFLGLPKLLLSSTHLVHLELWKLTDSGYISPEAMVTCLSVLTRLETLLISFERPVYRSHPKSQLPCTLLPVLTVLEVKVVCEYLEDLVARIEAPLLDKLSITFFHQLIFDTQQLTQFISRTPKLKADDGARVSFSGWGVSVRLPPTFVFEWGIPRARSSLHLSSLVRVCSSSFLQALIPTVERLYISESGISRPPKDGFESSQWLEFFLSFTAVKDLYVSRIFAPLIAPALQGLVYEERVTGVLPALQTLFLEETLSAVHVQKAIDNFVTARQLTSYPIAVSRWEREEFEWYW